MSCLGLVTPAAKLDFTGMARGGTTTTREQYKGLVEIANYDNESIPAAEKKMDKINVVSCTEHGTPVASSPSHCVWMFTDKHLRDHVGVSIVLPTSVGLLSKQLKNTVSDEGKSLRVNRTPTKLVDDNFSQEDVRGGGTQQGAHQLLGEH
jgi:hypothetical protein